MCGIFGYIGEEKRNLSDYLLNNLSKLEYRGYDSSGIAVFKNNHFLVLKKVGEIKNLSKLLKNKIIYGEIGIGHTRWATHGGVIQKNAHPHLDCKKKIAVVHNGIIENYQQLKKELILKNHKFISETDTEIFSHLVEENLKNKKNSFLDAVRISFNKIEGLNAVVVASSNQIVAFRRGSPLVAGITNGGSLISSDISTLSSETSKIIFIKENQGVLLDKKRIRLIDIRSKKLQKPKIEKIKLKKLTFEKGKFKYFLIKEIFEQPEVLNKIAKNNKKEIEEAVNLIKKSWGTYFTACGTAAHSGLAATYIFSEIAKRHVNFAFGSEFIYYEDFLMPRSLLIAASQSGETIDTIEAVKVAKKHKSKVLTLVNVFGSTLTRLSDKNIYLKAGSEEAVLSTKAYIAKLATFILFAYTIIGKYKMGTDLIKKTARSLSLSLENWEKKIKILAKKIIKTKHIYLIGRGVNYPTALEGALKIKEASYIHAEGFAGGELKHGVIALIEKGTPCIVIVANDKAKNPILSNAMELKSRGGFIIGISPTQEEVFDFWIKVPDLKIASPIVNIVPLQLLAYHLTILKGYNPDKPRNLAKSVTVK